MRERMASRSWSYCLEMCSVIGSLSARAYRDSMTATLPWLFPRRGSPDRIERRAGRDRLRVDAHLDHGGLARGETAIEGRAELGGLLHDLAHGAEGAGERGEVRIHEVRARHAPGIVLL